MARWLNTEERRLRDLWGSPGALLAAALPRHSVDAIYVHANKMGLRRRMRRPKQVPDCPVTQALIERRLALGLSRAALARRMRADKGTVASAESGSRPPRLSTLKRWAAALELKVALVPAGGCAG